MIGWIGVGLLVVAYFILLFANIKWFYLVDSIASLLLTVHAVMIQDVPFILVNSFIMCVLFYKYIKEINKESENGINITY